MSGDEKRTNFFKRELYALTEYNLWQSIQIQSTTIIFTIIGTKILNKVLL